MYIKHGISATVIVQRGIGSILCFESIEIDNHSESAREYSEPNIMMALATRWRGQVREKKIPR